jgi:hypothetical protein
MNDNYLWDGSGEPDPELQRLETLLSEFRHSGAPLVLPLRETTKQGKLRDWMVQGPWHFRQAAFAGLVVVLLAGIFLVVIPRSGPLSHSGWVVAPLEGSPQIGTKFILADHAIGKLEVGQMLETDGVSRASLSDEALGQVDVERNSRVRLLETNKHRKRILLEVGTIRATIWAPPGEFVVDTPSAVAVDLGCAYTLQVAPDGSGTLHTSLGWVGFHLDRRESFIPAGAMCSTRPKLGPGTPYFENASESFRLAVLQFDFNPRPEARSAALSTLLSQARTRDGLSLWHLLSRTDGAERAQVYDRFAALVPPPAGVQRDGILRLNPEMLDLWWNALGLGNISTWRRWQQSWSAAKPVNR